MDVANIYRSSMRKLLSNLTPRESELEGEGKRHRDSFREANVRMHVVRSGYVNRLVSKSTKTVLLFAAKPQSRGLQLWLLIHVTSCSGQ